jgi:hypothetical protein
LVPCSPVDALSTSLMAGTEITLGDQNLLLLPA